MEDNTPALIRTLIRPIPLQEIGVDQHMEIQRIKTEKKRKGLEKMMPDIHKNEKIFHAESLHVKIGLRYNLV